jgi:hypothetical protein
MGCCSSTDPAGRPGGPSGAHNDRTSYRAGSYKRGAFSDVISTKGSDNPSASSHSSTSSRGDRGSFGFGPATDSADAPAPSGGDESLAAPSLFELMNPNAMPYDESTASHIAMPMPHRGRGGGGQPAPCDNTDFGKRSTSRRVDDATILGSTSHRSTARSTSSVDRSPAAGYGYSAEDSHLAGPVGYISEETDQPLNLQDLHRPAPSDSDSSRGGGRHRSKHGPRVRSQAETPVAKARTYPDFGA